MQFILVNQEAPGSKELVTKIAKAKDGSIIPLTPEEMKLYRSADFQTLLLDFSKGQPIAQPAPPPDIADAVKEAIQTPIPADPPAVEGDDNREEYPH